MENPAHTYRCLPLLVTIVATILTAPLMRTSWEFGMALGIFWSVLFGIAGYLVFPTPRWLKIYTPLVLVAVAAQSVGGALDQPEWATAVTTLAILAIHTLTFFVVMRHALFAKVRHELDRVVAAVSGYFVLALIWTRLFALLILNNPKALDDCGSPVAFDDDPTIVYFSLTTLTTVGYGDVTPMSDFARLLASVEGAVGTLYIAVVIASLIGRVMARSGRS